jgi:DNA topoisomerase I
MPSVPVYVGHAAAANLQKRIESLVADIPAMFALVENRSVTALAKEIADCLADHQLAIEGLIQSEYGRIGNRQAKSCGANADGGGGFQPGNTCAGEGSGGGGGSSRGASRAATPRKGESTAKYDPNTKKFTKADGKPLPPHVPKWPPAWTNVTYAERPDASVLVRGVDSKGRAQTVQNPTEAAKNAARKFEKVRELVSSHDAIRSEIDQDRRAGVEAADVLGLIHATGLRPGSDKDTGADKQAYGATTLRREHVVSHEDGVRLEFVGKKGKDLSIQVDDESIASMLRQRASNTPAGGRLFDVNERELNAYAKSKGNGAFTAKDFRTAKGTTTAIKQIESMPAPTSDKEYKAAVKQVATKVSDKLGNTPTIALQSYIDPHVFQDWRSTAGV